mmetsp:Transcript_74705/g.161546  ORF Transcript_74705/g.161546 Transcript_74705/m.161546 type:complete len:670 (+) Transcript_74705:139-2148(+)
MARAELLNVDDSFSEEHGSITGGMSTMSMMSIDTAEESPYGEGMKLPPSSRSLNLLGVINKIKQAQEEVHSINNQSAFKCNGGHFMERCRPGLDTTWDSHTCDRCKRKHISDPEIIYRCAACNYDECEKCATAHHPSLGVTTPLGTSKSLKDLLLIDEASTVADTPHHVGQPIVDLLQADVEYLRTVEEEHQQTIKRLERRNEELLGLMEAQKRESEDRRAEQERAEAASAELGLLKRIAEMEQAHEHYRALAKKRLESAAGALIEHLRNGPLIIAVNAWHKIAVAERLRREKEAHQEAEERAHKRAEAAAGAFLANLRNGPVIAAINAWHKVALDEGHKRKSAAKMEKAAGAILAHLRNGPLIATMNAWHKIAVAEIHARAREAERLKYEQMGQQGDEQLRQRVAELELEKAEDQAREKANLARIESLTAELGLAQSKSEVSNVRQRELEYLVKSLQTLVEDSKAETRRSLKEMEGQLQAYHREADHLKHDVAGLKRTSSPMRPVVIMRATSPHQVRTASPVRAAELRVASPVRTLPMKVLQGPLRSSPRVGSPPAMTPLTGRSFQLSSRQHVAPQVAEPMRPWLQASASVPSLGLGHSHGGVTRVGGHVSPSGPPSMAGSLASVGRVPSVVGPPSDVGRVPSVAGPPSIAGSVRSVGPGAEAVNCRM